MVELIARDASFAGFEEHFEEPKAMVVEDSIVTATEKKRLRHSLLMYHNPSFGVFGKRAVQIVQGKERVVGRMLMSYLKFISVSLCLGHRKYEQEWGRQWSHDNSAQAKPGVWNVVEAANKATESDFSM